MNDTPSSAQPEALFLAHLSWINRVAEMVTSQHGIWGPEAEDFASSVRLKLMEGDYAIFRMYRGESSLKTYLATIIHRQLLVYLREHRGRWRPSAMARRLGPLAVRLEALVHRDGYSVSQAITQLQTAEAHIPEERELLRIFDQLPKREFLRPRESELDLHHMDPEQADTRLREAELEQTRENLHNKLERALASLPEEDRVIVRLHFLEGLTLGEVARALNLEQKPLYRRVKRLREALRQQLEEEGVDTPMVRSALPGDADL